MKKIVSLLFISCMALFLSVPAQAQIKFGVKGGVNISRVHFNKDIKSPSNVTGFQIGPMIETTVPLLGIGIDLALLYSQRGMKILGEEIKTDYMEIPLNLKWKSSLPLVKPFLAIGPYMGFRIGGDKRWEFANDQITTKNFAAGLNFGGGVEMLNHLQIGLNYGLGLSDNYTYRPITAGEADRSTGKNRGWSITAAILF